MSLEETELIESAEAALHQADDGEQIENIEQETVEVVEEEEEALQSSASTEITSTAKAQMSQASSATVPASASTTTTLQKIAPKPAFVKQTVTAGSKIVYIKSPNGTPQPIRIGAQLLNQNAATAATNSTNAAGTAGSPAIQFIKTLDGNFLQIKNKNVVAVQKTIAPSPTTPVTAGNSSPASSANNTRFVVKSGTGSRLILATPPTPIASKPATNAAATVNAAASVGNTRTLTVSQAQQMGLISSSKLKELVSAATANKTSPTTANKPAAIAPATTAGTTTIASTNAAKGPPTILNKGVKSWQSPKILLQSKSNTSNSTTVTTTTAIINAPAEVKTTKIAHNVVKISQNSQLRAVNVAGKGLQYVRVLNSSGSANAPAAASSSANIVKQTVTNGGRQQPVFVQRKILPQTQASTSADSGVVSKPQFITKKLEVTPLASTTAAVANRIAIARPKPNPAMPTKSTAILLNNTQKPVVNTPIDLKPASGHSQSFEITTVPKSEPLPPAQKLPIEARTNRDKRSYSPDPNSSTLYYSTLKLPSPEPTEGKFRPNGKRFVKLLKTTSISLSHTANRSRKHCNCTKSQCLKLYCDCFASGEFCQNCNCKECFNTLEKEDERQKAIKICLERNPHAFKWVELRPESLSARRTYTPTPFHIFLSIDRPKIGKARDQSDTLRRHTKGCNCKRSGCLKNYCECYEAKIVCSGNCKCIGN